MTIKLKTNWKPQVTHTHNDQALSCFVHSFLICFVFNLSKFCLSIINDSNNLLFTLAIHRVGTTKHLLGEPNNPRCRIVTMVKQNKINSLRIAKQRDPRINNKIQLTTGEPERTKTQHTKHFDTQKSKVVRHFVE